MVSGVISLGLTTKVLPAASSRRDLPTRLEERIVPRGDEAADTYGLVHHDAVDLLGPGIDDPPAALVHDEVGEVAEGVAHTVHVDPALFEGLSRVLALQSAEQFPVALQQVRHAP